MMKFKLLLLSCVCSLAVSSCVQPTLTKPVDITAVPPSAIPVADVTPYEEPPGALNIQQNFLCPTNPEVGLDKLGLPTELNLVVLPLDVPTWGDTDTAYSLLSITSSTPDLIVKVAPQDGWLNRNYIISPDGKWVSYIRWEISNPTNRELLMSSLDGSKQTLIMKLPDIYSYGSWVSNNKLAIIGVSDSSQQNPKAYLYIPLKIIDTITLEQRTLMPLPDEDINRDQLFVFSENQTVYDLYRIGFLPFERFTLYDYTKDLSFPVFQWLTKRDDINLMNTRVFYENGVFSAAVARPYGLDVSLELNLDSIKLQSDYWDTMTKVNLPSDLLPVTVYTWIPKTTSLLLGRSSADTDNPEPWKLYSLNYNQQIVSEYCLDISPNLDSILPSPDGHFVAFSYQESDLLQGGITILNLDTGFISVIDGLQMIGWGIK